MLPVKRTIKNNKFLYRQPCYGWRYFMLLLYIAHDISLSYMRVAYQNISRGPFFQDLFIILNIFLIDIFPHLFINSGP